MKLNAVMCAWNEEDVIESTIKHLFAQGCSDVFIVDNDSDDATVKNAVRAGAKLAATFKTKYFSEDQKLAHLNVTVQYVNSLTPDEQIWWLYVDADEFPHLEGGLLINYLNALDSSIRAIHGYMVNHIPSHPPYNVPGLHPADFQPLCTKTTTSKVPLLRYDKGAAHLWSIGGAHDFITYGETVPTLREALSIHYFPYRSPEHTFKRLKKLVERNNEGIKSGDWYKEFSNQISKSTLTAHEARYKNLNRHYNQSKYLELKSPSLDYDYKNLVRWYGLHIHEPTPRASYEEYIWIAVYYFFMKEYDLALCRFNDIFDTCEDGDIKLWLMVKIAECLEHTGSNDARDIISSIKKLGRSELNAYIEKYIESKASGDKPDKFTAAKIHFYKSDFAPGVEEGYRKMMPKIEYNISTTINKSLSARR